MRLAVVTNILAPYRIPLFEQLAKRCGDFLVLLLADRHSTRDWNASPATFRTRTLPGIRIAFEHSVDPLHLNVGTWNALRSFRPDAVLGGGFTPAHLASAIWCRMHDREYVPWGELTLDHPSESFAPRRWIRRWMIRGSRSFVASSTATRAAFVHYGADPDNVLVSPMPVGTSAFQIAADGARAAGDCERLRQQYGAPFFVSAGRLVDSKGWPELLRSFRRVTEVSPKATLAIAGDGPRRADYVDLARSLNLGARVHFLGQRTAPELAALFAAADVFALSTLADPYCAVLAEAMTCGAVAVASPHAAATADLVTHGDNGFIADPRDERAFAVALLQAAGLSPEQRQLLRARMRERIPADDMESSARAIADYLATRVAMRRGAPSLECQRDVT